MLIIKIGIVLFLAIWLVLGFWLVTNYNKLFGPHEDDPAESPGARSFGVAHIIAVWLGGAGLGVYFLIQ